VVDLLDQAAEVAAPVAVAVGVRLDVEAVDDGVLPPQSEVWVNRMAACTRSR
jgi:hypothetical protein